MNFNHIGVLGATRSGKTYFSDKKIHRAFKGPSIFCHFHDPQTTISGAQADKNDSVEVLRAGILIKKAKINYELSSNPAQALKEIGLIYHYAKKFNTWVQIIIDEAHRLIPEGGKQNIIDDAIRDGLKHKVRIVLISQSPADIRKKSLKQVDTLYIFRLNVWEDSYLKDKGMDPQEVKKLTSVKYSWAKIEAGNIEQNTL